MYRQTRDYYNSLYAHCNVSTRQRLQRVQNRAARLVLNSHHHAHHLCLCYSNYIGCRLKQEYNINYSLMYRVTHGLAPTYLTDLCEQCSNTRLRSASRGDYILPRSRLRCVDSSFSISAPTAWNNLPAHIRSCTSLSQFLSKLKSHLFNFHHLFPSSVISSHIVHIPGSGLSFFLFIFTFI